MNNNAVLLTDGMLHTTATKTAQNLIRGTERYQTVGVVDALTIEQEAGMVLDGQFRDIPIFSTVADAVNQIEPATYAIIAIATNGGMLPTLFLEKVIECIKNGLSIVNGLHDFLTDNTEPVPLACEDHAQLIDMRKPKPR